VLPESHDTQWAVMRNPQHLTYVSEFTILEYQEFVLFAKLSEAVDHSRVKIFEYIDVGLSVAP
jgi:hypothetical protein